MNRNCCNLSSGAIRHKTLSELAKCQKTPFENQDPFTKQDEINIRGAAEDKDRVKRIMNHE